MVSCCLSCAYIFISIQNQLNAMIYVPYSSELYFVILIILTFSAIYRLNHYELAVLLVIGGTRVLGENHHLTSNLWQLAGNMYDE